MNDLKFALRQLTKSPGFTAVAVLSLALGIGTTTTVLCWLQNLVQHPLPGVAAQEQLAVLVSNQGGGNVSLPDLEDFTKLDTIFAGAVASQTTPASLTVDEQPEWIGAEVVSANYFGVLGVKPILGRAFLPDEDKKPGGNPVLVISESLWWRRFDANPAVIGRVVDLNRHQFTIIGVAPASFRGTITAYSFDVWAPLSMLWEVRNQAGMTARTSRGWHNLVRLQPGVSVAQAHAAVQTLNAQLTQEHPRENRDISHRVAALSGCPWGAQTVMGPVLRLLLAVCAGVLLVVAANVANLLLARAASRQKEIAIRLAAGASRLQLIRQMLVESVVLGLIGGAAGVLLANWMVDSMPLFLPRLPANVVLDFHWDRMTLGLTLMLTLGTGIAFGLVPAWQASRTNLSDVLKQGGRSSAGGASHHRMRHGLVVAEVALALVLLIGAGLCLKGLRQARRVDYGFNPDGVLIAGLQIGMNGYTKETGPAFYRQLRQRLADLPGVEEAALASWFPLGLAGCKGSNVEVEGYVRPAGGDITYEYAIVSPRYFGVMQIPLVAGRDFTDADDAGTAPVAIVNEYFAKRFWPGRDPLGQKFRSGGKVRTVVGVARAGKYNRLSESPWCYFYLPYQQGVPDLDLSICVRPRGGPAASTANRAEGFAPAVRQAVRSLDPTVELLRTITLAEYTSAVLFPQRMASMLLMLLGGIALTLAAMGVYAVMAFAVSQRTQEFGVRIALGATPGDVLRQVIRQGLGLVALGTVVGLAIALGVTHLMASFLYGVSPFDPVTFGGVPLLLAAVAVLACYLPARRATRINPIEALRAE